jgi:hypothetical protein
LAEPTFADLLAAGKATQDALRRRRASATNH